MTALDEAPEHPATRPACQPDQELRWHQATALMQPSRDTCSVLPAAGTKYVWAVLRVPACRSTQQGTIPSLAAPGLVFVLPSSDPG